MSAYRPSPFANLTPVAKNLLIINIIFFVGTFLLSKVVNLEFYLSAFYFNSPLSHPWQIITYMFMHANIWHIGFNMLGLYFLGPILEYSMGPKRFLQYYFITGVGALLLQWIVQAIQLHGLIGAFYIPHGDYTQFAGEAVYEKIQEIYRIPILGASGAIFGLAVALAVLYPNLEMMILFIPVPVKAKYAVTGYIVIELISGFGQVAGDNVAHFAHLGGALIGFIVLKTWRMKSPGNFY